MEGGETIRGLLERITFASEESGWAVYKISVKGSNDVVAAVGYASGHMVGEELELTGEWSEHPKFGRQFKFDSCRATLPSTVEGVKRYLASGLIKGIGPKMAERIVDMFGAETLDVLDESPDDLLEVRGISEKLLDSIKLSWNAQKDYRAVMMFLYENGVSPNFAAKIYAAYGSDTIEVVRENPYRLAADIFGVGFLTADKVALSMGIPPDSPMRIQAGVSCAMGDFASEGHVYAPRDLLAQKTASLLSVDEAAADLAIDAAAAANELVVERITTGDGQIDAVYLPAFYTAESRAAVMLADLGEFDELERMAMGARALGRDAAESWVRSVMKISLAPEQLDAIELAARSKLMVVTGGPGTGKTTIIRAMIGICCEQGMEVMLAAPTGRAAKRLSEATGREAKTIHRLLEYTGQGGFARNADSPLECDMLVVDEASMIDIVLFYHLLRAVPSDCRLILVGDVDQLPSVGPGNVLRDMIASGTIPTAVLGRIFRQAETSSIIVNAHKVNSGQLPEEPQRPGLKDFYIIEQDDPDKCVELIVKIVAERIKSAYGLDPIDDVQVLTPMHRGTLGAANLNNVLQRALNSSGGPGIERGGRTFMPGDKVMQTRNDYERDVFNGDIGRITAVDAEAGLITVDIDGRSIVYDSSEFDSLVHAYAVSIHKSQGSEYPAVVIPVHTQHYVMLQRNLLYTAITRGKELVVIAGTKKALSIAVRTDGTKRRFTYLCERLRARSRRGG